jgi:uncharacterized protein YbjT (DUF2867 family)
MLDDSPQNLASKSSILITGATGYVGGRLVHLLEGRGYELTCLARRPEHLRGRVAPETRVMQGDAVTGEGLEDALSGVETAYYLIHSMGSPDAFETQDRIAAENFAHAAKNAGVRRIVYLGGLVDATQPLSSHLRSRMEVGNILRRSGVPVTELRASIVIGSGSLSFEMIRAIVEHLPILITPRWVSVEAQPIGIDDLLQYLVGCLDIDETGNPIYEIGGSDRTSYGGMMREYARQRGLRRVLVPVPVLTPRLSSLWLGLVSPLYARVGRKLIDSIRTPTIVQDPRALEVFDVVPGTMESAMKRALENEDREFAQTHWSDALSASGSRPPHFGGMRMGRRLVDSREKEVSCTTEQAFAPIQRIGGSRGWYAANFLWKLRGWIDLLVGGVGMRRGRRHPVKVGVGDALDCWRVVGFEPARSLRLSAEMKLPGRAWLHFEVEPAETGARIRQTAIFEPRGLPGLLYWYGIYPLHAYIFHAMLHTIAESAQREPGEEPSTLATTQAPSPQAWS